MRVCVCVCMYVCVAQVDFAVPNHGFQLRLSDFDFTTALVRGLRCVQAMLSLSHTHTGTHSRTHMHTGAHTHMHTGTHTHTYRHTHAQARDNHIPTEARIDNQTDSQTPASATD